MAIGTFSMAPAIGPEFAIVAIPQQRVVVWVRLHKDVAAVSAIAARRSASRNVLLPAKSDAAVAAVAALHYDFGFINKHG